MKPSDGSVDPTLTPSQAGSDLASGDTVAATESDSPPRARGGWLSLAGYQIGSTLGQGGMGEVLLARDERIGRDIAIKCMRSGAPAADAIERFLREAKIQARLDHPAIVPVHELGEDAGGRPYFTMKRLAGKTLQDVLGEPGAAPQRLLRAFVDVCTAAAFAHARGVVHRDLKPSNIMLGEYGEVYVMDWGVARVVGEGGGDAGAAHDISTLEGHTQAGALLGTPGYMAPEQVRGEDVGPPADVYALGCILFEILAREALHPRGGQAAIASTVGVPTQSPAQRKPALAIAPELDSACRAALAEKPEDRPTAAMLAERVQGYLDGDRDLEHRRRLAADELAAARAASRDPARRAEAVRHAGRALVLDPESQEASSLIVQLLVEPPAEVPQAVEANLAEHDSAMAARASWTAAGAILAYFLFVPLLLWMGVREWGTFLALYGLVALMAFHAAYQARTGRVNPVAPLVANIAIMLLLSRLASPLFIVPTMICTYVATLTTQSRIWRRPGLVIAFGVIAFLLPIGLEWTGLCERTWWVEPGRIVLAPGGVQLASNTATFALVVLVNVGMILVNVLFARAMAQSRDEAHRRLEIQAWHLRQLLPVEAPRPEPPAVMHDCPADRIAARLVGQ